MACHSKRPDIWYQVLLIGDASVGKTCILHRQCNNEFLTTAITTVGFDTKGTVKTMKDGTLMRIMFLDTAGTERFDAMMPAFYRKADAFVFVYDITRRSSFEGLTKWLNTIDRHTNPTNGGTKVMLIGNKADLEAERAVSYEEGMEFAEETQMRFFETSALTGAKVDDAMDYLASELEKRPIACKDVEHYQPSIHVHEKPKKPNGGCRRCWSSSPSTSDQPNDIALHWRKESSGAVASIDANTHQESGYKCKPGLECFQYSPDSLGELQDLEQEVSSKWKPIARHLRVPEDIIESIEKQYKVEGTVECLIKVFDWWQKNQTKPYTWAILIDILEKPSVGQCNVAKRLRQTLEQRQPHPTT